MYLKRKWSVLLAVVLALGLSACGSKVPSSEVPGEPPVAGQQDQTPRDWREDAAITIRSTAAYSSETVNVCVCAEDGKTTRATEGSSACLNMSASCRPT